MFYVVVEFCEASKEEFAVVSEVTDASESFEVSDTSEVFCSAVFSSVSRLTTFSSS